MAFSADCKRSESPAAAGCAPATGMNTSSKTMQYSPHWYLAKEIREEFLQLGANISRWLSHVDQTWSCDRCDRFMFFKSSYEHDTKLVDNMHNKEMRCWEPRRSYRLPTFLQNCFVCLFMFQSCMFQANIGFSFKQIV